MNKSKKLNSMGSFTVEVDVDIDTDDFIENISDSELIDEMINRDLTVNPEYESIHNIFEAIKDKLTIDKHDLLDSFYKKLIEL